MEKKAGIAASKIEGGERVTDFLQREQYTE